MTKMVKVFLYSLSVLLFLGGCNPNETNDDIFQFKDSFVGDNSAIGNIANQLREGDHLQDFELKTNEEPYGITLNYNWVEAEQEYKETAVYNATFLFALVQNVDWITFNFDNREYTLSRENLEDWYGIELSGIQNEDELRELTKASLVDDNQVNQLFK